MRTRAPAVAGQFYPADRETCVQMIQGFLRGFEPQPCLGAIVPHAGWVYSGTTSAMALACVAAGQAETVVFFGTAHGPDHNPASLYPAGVWQTPLGAVEVDEAVARGCARAGLVVAAPEQHAGEHAIEVQVPILAYLAPQARIVPISVRPGPEAVEVGCWCAVAAAQTGRKLAFVGSTDLTHYGPAFGFEPHGHGRLGVRWAKEVNDRRMVKLIAELRAEDVVGEASVNRNACGPGAIAATIAALRELGATEYRELQHTCSAEVHGEDPETANSVGYEAGIFVRPPA